MAKAAPSVSLEEFAEDHGVTVRTVTNWINDGMPHRERGGVRRVVRVLANKWRADQIRRQEEAKAAGGLWSREREMAKKIAVERQLKELELRRELGQSLTLADFDELRDRLIGGFASVVAGQLQPFERKMGLEPEHARALTLEMQTALMRGANQLADALEAEADEIEASALDEDPEVVENEADDDLEDDQDLPDDQDPEDDQNPPKRRRPSSIDSTPMLPPPSEPDLFSDLGEVPGS